MKYARHQLPPGLSTTNGSMVDITKLILLKEGETTETEVR